jgi:hypothetical protein
MNFEGRFAEQIMPDQLHILNVSFFLPTLRRDFGGCAGNIAYGLKLLGGNPLPMATVGVDSNDYVARMSGLGISTEFVRAIDGAYTAQAMIITDKDNNQITGFHPGAMEQAHTIKIEKRSDIHLGIVAPDGFDAMVEFTAPVFWFFLFLIGIAVFVLRHKHHGAKREFSIPLYPLTPLLFCLSCAYLSYSSFAYAHSKGAVYISIYVMLVGIAALVFLRINKRHAVS